MASIALSVENLSWHYQTNHILSQVNLTLEAGKTLGVIGQMGLENQVYFVACIAILLQVLVIFICQECI